MEIKIGSGISYGGKNLIISDIRLKEDVTGLVVEIRAMDEEKARTEQITKNDIEDMKRDPAIFIRKIREAMNNDNNEDI
jgi:hypothetical protein